MVNVEMTDASPQATPMDWTPAPGPLPRSRSRKRTPTTGRRSSKPRGKGTATTGRRSSKSQGRGASSVPALRSAARKAAIARLRRRNAERSAANKANSQARREAVERSQKEAESARRARKAAENAAAKKAAENAEKAKKLAANAIVKNVDNKLKVIKNGPGSKENKNKLGKKVYRKASLKLHPQRPGGSEESFKKLGSIYSNFQTKIGTKVRVEQELSNENRPR